VLHSEIIPEQDCGGEVTELPEDEPTHVRFAQCARCGTEFTFLPDSDWVTVVYPGKQKLSRPQYPRMAIKAKEGLMKIVLPKGQCKKRMRELRGSLEADRRNASSQ
jgi:hypothetical protein